MKKVILPFISVLLMVAVAFGTGKKEKLEGRGETAQKVSSTSLAASSPWLPVNPAFGSLNVSLNGVAYSPTNSKVLWVSGTSPTAGDLVFRSTDGGANWTQNTVSTAGITSIAVKNDTIAIVGLYTGQILRTKNGGAKWDTVFAYGVPASAFMDGVAFVGSTRDTAIGIGDADALGSMITRSTNGGLTWTRINTLPTADQEANGYVAAADYGQALSVAGNTIWTTWYFGASRNPRIVKSTDAGVTWTGAEYALPGGTANNYYFKSINMKDANIGYAVCRRIGTTSTFDNYLLKTTNGGTSWDSLSVEVGVHNIQKVYAAKPIPGTNNVVAVGFSTVTGSKSWWSTNDGATWTTLSTPGTTNLTNAAFLSPTVGFAVGFLEGLLYSPSVAVTFMANTSGVPDTLKTTSTVQLRGSSAQLTWDNNSVKLTNAGGDYWKTTVRFNPTDTIYYKYFTNVKSAITGSDGGYEANVTPDASNNRVLIVPNNDTTLAVRFVNGFKNPAGPLEGPFVAKADSYTCYIRVNMQSFPDFNPVLHALGVRGSFPASNWGTTILGNVEKQHANPGQVSYDGTNFYNLAVRWPKTLIDTSTTPVLMDWKWVIHTAGHPLTEDWGLMVHNSNFEQKFNMPKKDTTVNWVWFENTPYIPPSGTDTTTFVFVTNLAKAIQSNSIKPGDSVSVRFGYNGSAALVTTHLMVKKGLTGTLYVDTAKVIGVKVDATKKGFNYQYYLTKNATEYREIYYDFFYTGSDPSLAEKRKASVTGKNITIVVYDTLSGGATANRQPYWQSTVKLARNVHVTFTCDLRPAYYTLFGGDTLFDVQSSTPNLGFSSADSVYKWGVWINGPAVGGWSQPTGNDWGVALRANLAKKMYDNGTHGDKVAGDHIYSMQQWFYKDSLNNTVGQVFKFGLNGGDNEGGQGGYGNNNVENINDADTIATVASDFGNINPKYFRFWSYDTHKPTSVSRVEGIPISYSLDQNYPNPFNPSTTINYSIPVSGRVTLRIFNVLGQEVGTLLNSDQNAGKYQLTFDASQYSSGVYFYRIEAGTFSAVKKMMLLK